MIFLQKGDSKGYYDVVVICSWGGVREVRVAKKKASGESSPGVELFLVPRHETRTPGGQAGSQVSRAGSETPRALPLLRRVLERFWCVPAEGKRMGREDSLGLDSSISLQTCQGRSGKRGTEAPEGGSRVRDSRRGRRLAGMRRSF